MGKLRKMVKSDTMMPKPAHLPARQRLAGPDRRKQMLEVAVALIREEGVGALTLARLAAAAGVTKPVAYQHFETREGLLCALYQQLGQHHERAAGEALAALSSGTTPPEAAAEVVAAAIIDCILENGDSYAAIIAALASSPQGAGTSAALRQSIVTAYAAVLTRAANLTTAEALARALLGAGEGLAQGVRNCEISHTEAITTLSAMLAAGSGLSKLTR